MQKPAIQHDMPRKPAILKELRCGEASQPGRQAATNPRHPTVASISSSFRNLPVVGLPLRSCPGSPSCKNGLRSEECGLDRRQNPFTALRPGQSRGIADQQKAIAGDLTLRSPV